MINSRGHPRSLGYVRFFIGYYTTAVGSLLICTLTLGKVLLLKYPLRIGLLPKRQTHNICAVIWIICITPPGICLVLNKDDVLFDFRTYSYTYGFTSNVLRMLLPMMTVIFLVVPNIIVIVSTIMLLKRAKKAAKTHRQTLKWQGITTVGLTALVHTFSIFPIIFYFTARSFIEKHPQNPGPFFVEYYRVTHGLVILHVLSNFFVYSLTVESFRSFLKTKLCGVLTRFLATRVSHRGNVTLCVEIAYCASFKPLLHLFLYFLRMINS